ncbi:LysM peptidoglycan-binding domain-containing protein, partial [candidate division KSB1 bacterium]|nr:LysM peptidoglycan-binding domain-containing protein [candidate division KSB1 bacterium]NIR71604.1 LysM peptidoglycan-binding domain-containing protein [candidate division KSB1 bacterium]NIS23439.1 LysM peptidoglycan-binding domain-containing protein [candidate division KSB1 bacterium]NIT70347.1 LysM peptidoglycan-binding domain-containing protein [candidate division KSB1 bacterium]NIU24049.1 LysM peptidoglycan-binding domain-containing protein [candidate division KSB1 bacterium]
ITAYNHGLYGIKRARRRYGNDLGKIVKYYRSRSFGFASRNFYAEFLAALHVSNNYKFYFGDIELYRARGYATFETPDYVWVKILTDALNIDVEEFAEFNPALRPPVLQSRRRIPKGFKIRIPLQENLDIEQLYAQISPKEKFEDQVRPEWHKVRPGEYLITIARKYRVPLSDLMALNNISNPHRIYAGQNLQLPSQASRKVAKSEPKIKVEKPTQLAEATDLTKEMSASVVDVPSSISLEYPTDEVSEKGSSDREHPKGTGEGKLAYLPARSNLHSDNLREQPRELKSVEIQNLVIQTQNIEEDMALALPDFYVQVTKSMDVRIVQVPHMEAVQESFRDLNFPQNGQVTVEPDETLGHFADWLDVSTQKIRNINGLSFWEPIRIGQPLWLTFRNVTPEEFHRRRIEYHQGIEEDFYRNFSIEGEKLYRIRQGDNIWLICNREVEIPYWLVKKYNPDKDLLHLVADEEIVIPIVEDKHSKVFLETES